VYAIIETGGKQYRVSKGDVIDVERLAGDEGDEIVFDRVLAVGRDDGTFQVGSPVVEGATCRGKIVSEFKDKKVIAFKYKPKVNYRRKKGHRQVKTKIRIEEISAG